MKEKSNTSVIRIGTLTQDYKQNKHLQNGKSGLSRRKQVKIRRYEDVLGKEEEEEGNLSY